MKYFFLFLLLFPTVATADLDGLSGNDGNASGKSAAHAGGSSSVGAAAAVGISGGATIDGQSNTASPAALKPNNSPSNGVGAVSAAGSGVTAIGANGDATGLNGAGATPQSNAFPPAGDGRSAADLAQQAQLSAQTESTVHQRARQLMAGLRGDAGDMPPGAAVEASPLPLAFMATPAPREGVSPASVLASGLSGRDPAFAQGDTLLHRAAVKMGLSDFAGAEDLLTRRLAAEPNDETALRFRALARRWLKRFEPSSNDARSALALKPGDSGARAVLIEDLLDLGRSREALDAADQALALNPRDARVLAARADVWATLGETARRLADLKAAAEADAEFDSLYRRALSGGAPPHRGPGSFLVWLGAIGTALLFFSFALFRRRGDTSRRTAMRAEDRAVLARAAAPALAPQGFRIERTLGEGGMGVVYEAVDLALQRPVALKKLRAEIADVPRERARFLKEARTVAALRHPNIVAIHAIHEDASGIFLVFEKVDGQTLHERLHSGLTPAETVGYLRQVAKALDYAHAHGVIHQDLKPANVMVSGGEAKVMDFGIARRVAETLSTLSKVEISGTPVYMAPEQEFGQNVGPAADVFALGVCAYELLTGRRPFPEGGLMMKTRGLYRPASESGTPAAADAVLARALAPEPAARWPSASAFVEALARSLTVVAAA